MEFNPVRYTGLMMVSGWVLMVIGVTLLITVAVANIRRRKDDQ